MKNLIVISILLVSSLAQAKIFVVHSSSKDAGNPTMKSFLLSQGRVLKIDLAENDGDMRFNSLTMSIECKAERRTVLVDTIKTMCGLKSVDYSSADQSITLVLTKYNSASKLGDCSGKEYTEKYNLAGLCEGTADRSKIQAEDDLQSEAELPISKQ